MAYQIITDSCCDFTAEQYTEHRLSHADLTVTCGDTSRGNFTEPAAVRAFYGQLRQGITATTAAANPDTWAAQIRPVLAAGRDALVLCFSSGLSTTYQSAVIAAGDLKEAYPQRKVIVIDTLCASLGQGLLVHLACRKREEGMALETLAAWVEETKGQLCHWVTVDDLSHLKRGGRISAATAIMGTMMNIKPILCMDEAGRLKNTAKVRGRKVALEYLAQKFADTAVDKQTVFLGHGDCPEDASALEALLREQGAEHVITGSIGPVIGAHTGPGVLAVFFLGTKR